VCANFSVIPIKFPLISAVAKEVVGRDALKQSSPASSAINL
jgi:hypothetical protein